MIIVIQRIRAVEIDKKVKNGVESHFLFAGAHKHDTFNFIDIFLSGENGLMFLAIVVVAICSKYYISYLLTNSSR